MSGLPIMPSVGCRVGGIGLGGIGPARRVSFAFLTFVLSVGPMWQSSVRAQTLVLPGKEGATSQSFERVEEPRSVARRSDKLLQLGEITLTLPDAYEMLLDRGDLFGYPYFAKFTCPGHPDFFVKEIVFSGGVEDVANSFFRNYLQRRFTLQDSRYFTGPPQKLRLVVKGAEMEYHLYFVSLNQRNAFLIFVIPVAPGSAHGKAAEEILSRIRFH